jgi:hypothetical protein
MRRKVRESLRVEWQPLLGPKDDVREDQAHETEEQHRDSVLLPILFLLRINAKQAIRQLLKRLDKPVKKCLAVWIKRSYQISAEIFRDEYQDDDEEAKL